MPVLSLFLAILFLLLSLTVNLGLWRDFDWQTTVFLQKVISHQFDFPLSFFSLLGSFEASFSVLVLFLFLTFRVKKIFWWQALAFFVLLSGIETLGKNLIFQPLPPLDFFRYTLPFSFPTSGIETAYSFPSGHASRTVFLTVLISGLLLGTKISQRKKVLLLALALAFNLLMLLSRVYLGEHWFSDVIGGILLAASLGGLTLFFLPQLKKERS